MALAINSVFDASGMVTGGFSGIAIIIKAGSQGIIDGGIPLWVTNMGLNIPLFLIGWKINGFSFVKKALIGEIALSTWLAIEPVWNLAGNDLLLAALYGGVIQGVGIGLVFLGGGTTGGTDMMAAIIQKYLQQYSIAQIMQVIDAGVVLVGNKEGIIIIMDKLLDLTRDFDAAKAAFEAYLDEYDRADDKIHLKIVHTYGVVDAAEDIARRMGLGEEDVQLAKVIGLLHDIGRFEQIKRFDSFEPGTMEHAVYGAQLLFGPEKMIRRFVKDDRFDSLICTAIEKHSDFKLEEITDERTLLHAKLIRDADKLDNCRVKLEESMETLLGVDEKGVGEGVIAPKVWESCMAKESVLSSDRVSKVDYWISYIAQYYDINFPETYEIMREHDYVKRIMDRVPYALPETQEKMDILAAEMGEYMDERIRNKK